MYLRESAHAALTSQCNASIRISVATCVIYAAYLCYEEVYRRVFEKIDAFRRGEENVSPIQVAIMPSLHDGQHSHGTDTDGNRQIMCADWCAVGQCYPLPQPAFDLASFREALDVSHFPLEEDNQQMDTGSTPKVSCQPQKPSHVGVWAFCVCVCVCVCV